MTTVLNFFKIIQIMVGGYDFKFKVKNSSHQL